MQVLIDAFKAYNLDTLPATE